MRLPLRSQLGKTGVEVSRLGLGGHTFLPCYGGLERASRHELMDIVNLAIEEGINLFDVTFDEERQVCGSMLAELGVRDRIRLSCWTSKEKTQTAAGVKTAAERALSVLGLDYIDLLYLDWTCTPEQLEAMVELRDNGLTKLIGLLDTDTALPSYR